MSHRLTLLQYFFGRHQRIWRLRAGVLQLNQIDQKRQIGVMTSFAASAITHFLKPWWGQDGLDVVASNIG